MKNWKWIAGVTAAVGVIGGVGFYLFKKYKSRKKNDLALPHHNLRNIRGSSDEELIPKPDALEVLEEAFVESMDYVLQFYKLAVQGGKSMENSIREQSLL